ncbi:MAG: peptidase [Burkholderiales bacterium RIFCSPLOWO2_12_67_14]|nr:MAG: peptidase [Burkholderiales bacterium RIFCSPLOWO2_02_FULL_67_64]OGB41644.1 MAG: peptidase [Burkholderiales bacterium RIFCSPHIGHO2_12_FULL_67_38]OGB44241.1 MAG: peptidase [Burkholderiales bacterium RIFCSPLOWO2_12_67_14]OGC02453.1 MAG: peptidase [Burkholderiales bacterium RIFCSPLOWO2_12_FULL_67_210]
MSSPRASILALGGTATVAMAALAWASFAKPLPRLVYNPSDSVPVGWYRVDLSLHQPTSDVSTKPTSLQVGSIVLVRLPGQAAALAAQRGYLPLEVPLLKRVGAVAPQRVCIVGQALRIDGHTVTATLRADRLGRPLQGWPQCRRLRAGEIFLLSVTNPASFDSRYFGPVRSTDVIGTAHPLWLETQP